MTSTVRYTFSIHRIFFHKIMEYPLLMGVLNITPDSFFDGGQHFSLDQAVTHGLKLIEQGARILDIGGESTRPGAQPVSEKEECDRVLPAIEALAQRVSIPLSIDTSKAKVAALALEKGASWINDITGFSDPAMRELAACSQADLCLMHMDKTPQTMQNAPFYPRGVVAHVMHFFEMRIETLVQAGVNPSRIILDPGIGFGKTVKQNYQLLQAIEQFKSFGMRIMIGASRKSFLQKTVGKNAAAALSATLAAHSFCLFKGVDILRVHDVQEHHDALSVFKCMIT